MKQTLLFFPTTKTTHNILTHCQKFSLQFYHSRTNALVMTNEPNYAEQKKILAQYEPWGGNISLPENLPGTVGKFRSLDIATTDDRFLFHGGYSHLHLLLVC
jgi:penicillin V acylase-like amidase (Ntn superfamily)